MAKMASAQAHGNELPSPHHPPIPVLPSGMKRPQWSVMIPTFNCARYIPDALHSVLTQDPGSELMQIEVVDDCSSDADVEALVEEIGGGRIGFFRQLRNVGHIRNFNTCLKRSRGRLIHLLHGDDYVREEFYARMESAFDSASDIGAAFCRSVFADESGTQQGISPLEQTESGVLADSSTHLALEQRIMTPSIAVRREAYELLGGFDDRLVCSEDWEMWVRVATRYPIWYETKPLAVYRMHANSNTGRHTRTADDIRYSCVAINIFSEYLPTDKAARIASQARETYALAALNAAEKFAAERDFSAALAQTLAALRCRCSAKVGTRILRLIGQCMPWMRGRGAHQDNG
ncbi:MAG: glycosyltransferase [Gammaproteobacteria bacterium]|nr:glycosyltransferase [Gammaproteobacteria bacterium]